MKLLFLVSIFIWLIGFLFGITTYVAPLTETDSRQYQTSYGFTKSISNNTIIIFKNNFLGILILVLGGFLLSAPTISSLLFNGYQLSIIISSTIESDKSFQEIALLFLPHSIEFIGVWLGGALGFKIALLIFGLLLKNEKPTSKELSSILKYFLYVCIMITIGAIIEGYFSVKFI
jgi:stage II sporulation protein M